MCGKLTSAETSRTCTYDCEMPKDEALGSAFVAPRDDLENDYFCIAFIRRHDAFSIIRSRAFLQYRSLVKRPTDWYFFSIRTVSGFVRCLATGLWEYSVCFF